MQQSYTKNYIKIYFWQILSVVFNLLSLIIVIPKLSSQPDVYGIYSVCISSIIFLAYADLGFLDAGIKYASEYYAKGDRLQELRMTGFVSFILLLLTLVFSAVVFTLSLHPEWLIKNLSSGQNTLIARRLLMILAVFSPMVVLQRALMVIFGVRLQDYLFQGVLITVNMLKVTSVLYFFRASNYDIVGYFFFGQAITLIAYLIGFSISGRKYGITLWAFLKTIRFSKDLYEETKSLALSSFFVTISWIVYYELDVYSIAKLSGAKAVAYYSIGITCISFFRTIFGTLFNPFTARFNHFVALNDEDGLKGLYRTVLCVMLPIVVFPILALAGLSRPFVLSWVGAEFIPSILTVKLLVLSNVLAFIIQPSNILLIARKQIRALYYLAIFQPIFFWGGILLTFSSLGFVAFAYFKLLSFVISGLVYLWVSLKFLGESPLIFFNKLIRPAVLPVLTAVAIFYFVAPYMPHEKDKLNLIIVVATGGILSIVPFTMYYFTSSLFRGYINNIFLKFRKKTLAGSNG